MNTDLNAWQPKLIALASAGAGSDGAHDINHLQRVWRNAQALLESHPAADALVVMAGCYLHDLVNLPKNHPERAQASRQSAVLASRQLDAEGFPAARLAAVAHAIEAHSFSAAIEAATIEAKIVQDADRLDALGAIGIGRAFAYGGWDDRAMHDPAQAPVLHASTEAYRAAKGTTVNHFHEKLLLLGDRMTTATGRRIAAERTAYMEAFLERFHAEWDGHA